MSLEAVKEGFAVDRLDADPDRVDPVEVRADESWSDTAVRRLVSHPQILPSGCADGGRVGVAFECKARY